MNDKIKLFIFHFFKTFGVFEVLLFLIFNYFADLAQW